MDRSSALESFAALSVEKSRASGAAALARLLRIDDVLILAIDPVSGTLIPARGMPQTIWGGRAWRSFRSSLTHDGHYSTSVDLPPGSLRPVTALVTHGAALVLLGVVSDEEALAEVEGLLPLLAATLVAEQRLMAATAEAVSAADVAKRASTLATALETARSDAARLNCQLRTEDLAKDEFLATLAHELRNPLSGIRVSVSALQSPAVNEVAKLRILDAIDRQSRQLARLVDDLLDAARIRHGRIVLQVARIELRSAVAEAVELNRHMAEAKRHHVRLSLGEHDIFVAADATRLQQIIANLFVNACKYMDADGCIFVSTRCSENWATIEIRDTGIGIDAQMLPTIFELFTQAPVALKQAQGGLGIGLSLVKRLVDLHGGEIEAASAGRGSGSVFTVRIPRAIHEDIAR